MADPRVRRAGLLLGGLLLGLLLIGLGMWLYFRSAVQTDAVGVLDRVDLPPEVFELEAVEEGGLLRFAARDVVLLGPEGDTVAAVPLMRFALDPASLNGEGPIEITEVTLRKPYLNLVQLPGGGFNLSNVVEMRAGGEEVELGEGGEGRGIVLRDVEIVDGRVRLTTPLGVPDSIPPELAERIRLVRRGGERLRVLTIRDLDAQLPLVRVGGPDGWRVEVADLNARLADPDLRIVELQGVVEEAPREGIRFALDVLRTEDSVLEGEGVVRLAGEVPRFDIELRAHPLDFADVQWLLPTLPAGGRLEGVFALESREGERIAVAARELVVTAFDSRIVGRFSALVGGEEPIAFWDTRLELDPLRIETLEELGLRDEIPYNGEITGTIIAPGDSPGAAQGLQLDVLANLVPEELDVPPSVVALEGPVSLGGADAMVRFGGLRVGLQPLYLAALRPVLPGQEERLRGVLQGDFLLTGTLGELQIQEGELAYEVGGAPATRLTGITLQVTREPELAFELSAVAQPLALGTLNELFPALPLRPAQLTGPIRVAGTTEEFAIRADLEGAAGGLALQGTIEPGETLRFDVGGEVTAFRPSALLTREVPVRGPVTGTFAAAGTATDFRFDVDLAQGAGRFALGGRIRQAGGPPQFQVAGQVTDFNLGALIGRPGLFPSELSGGVELAGGGRAPYRFDVDLQGPVGALDLAGTYAPGDVPGYAVAGTVQGLDISELPGGAALPETRLNATINLAGRGLGLETLRGELEFAATGSTIAGIPVQVLRADLAVRSGVLVVDTLAARFAGARLAASGTWGLTRPAENPLRYELVARDLGALAPLIASVQGIEPQVNGSFVLEGSLAGSIERPLVAAEFRGQNLRYEGWRAQRLVFDVEAALGAGVGDLEGGLALAADEVVLAGGASFDAVRLQLRGREDRVAVGLALQRDAQSDLALRGVVELEGRVPRGLMLDSLALRVGDIAWELTRPAQLRWGGVEGVLVNNLLLRRVGEEPGLIRIDGAIPPEGDIALRVGVQELDLTVVERLLPNLPPIRGVVALDAVLQGPANDPDLTLEARIDSLRYRDVVADAVLLTARYDAQRLESNAAVWRAGEPVAEVEATVPVVLSLQGGAPSFDLLETAPLRARVVADSIPVGLLTAPVPTLRDGEGIVTAELAATGTIEQPILRGWAAIADGAVTIEPLGIRYEEIAGRLSLEEQLLRIDSLTIWSDGLAVLDGTVRFADLDNPELYLTADLNSFRAVDEEGLAELTVSGRLSLSGRLPEPVLSGRVVLDEGEISIPNLDERAPLEITDVDVGQIGQDAVPPEVVTGPGLLGSVRVQELEIAVEEGVWLDSEDARVEIRGELVIFRTGATPLVYGTLEATRGTYALTIGPLIREFEIVSGAVRFFGTGDLNPELDIVAAHEVRTIAGNAAPSTLTILVQLSGTLEYPRIDLTSNTRPPLPESELLNYLVFGRPTFQLAGGTRALAEQVLVQEFLGGLIAQELKQELGFLPCDYFRLRGRAEINTNPLNSTSVECGVQLVEDVFLTVETGVTALFGSDTNPFLGASLEWQIDNHFIWRLSREPVRSDPLLRLVNPEVQYQWSTDLKGRWEFGWPEESPPGITPPDPLLPGEVAPSPEEPKAEEASR